MIWFFQYSIAGTTWFTSLLKIGLSHILQSHKVFTATSARISEEHKNTLRFWTHSLITHCLYGSSGMCKMTANCKALGNVTDGLWTRSGIGKMIKATHWLNAWVSEKKKTITSSYLTFVFLSKSELTEWQKQTWNSLLSDSVLWNLRRSFLLFGLLETFPYIRYAWIAV